MDIVEKIFTGLGITIFIAIGGFVIFVVTVAVIYGVKRALRRLKTPAGLREYVEKLKSKNNVLLSGNNYIVEDALMKLLLNTVVNKECSDLARNTTIDCLVMVDCWGREIHKDYINLYTTNYSTQPISFARRFVSLNEGTSREELGTLIQLTGCLFNHTILRQKGLFLEENVDKKIRTYLKGWGDWCDFGSSGKPPPLPLFKNEIFAYYGDTGGDLAELFDCWHKLYSNFGLFSRKGKKYLQNFIEKLGKRSFTKIQIIF